MGLIFRLSLLLLIICVVEVYFFKKTIATVKYNFQKLKAGKRKLVTLIMIVFFNLYALVGIGYLIFYAVTKIRPDFPPESFLFDVFVQFPFWIFITCMIQCILFFLLIDVLRILLFPAYMKNREIVKTWVYKIQLALLILFVIYVPARICYDYFAVSTRIVEYKKDGLAKPLEGFKITFISDIQADKYTNPERLERFINHVNDTRPDLVLVAGDVITSTPDYIKQSAEYLGKIKSKYGIYSCIGDHDNWAYREDTKRSLREITSALASKNILMIDNQKRILEIDSAKIWITFVTNTYVEKINRDFLDSLTNGGMNADLKIFLTHQPRRFLIDEAVNKNYDLFLAGHTHGGQLTFLFPFFDLSPTLFETKYVRGDFHFGSMMAVVTRGLGMSLVPLRYNSTPEVTVIILKSK